MWLRWRRLWSKGANGPIRKVKPIKSAGRTCLVVAPYNAQVRAIRDLLPEAGRSRVGTVDKFQGQEAAVAIYSMTTSSADEAPHGLEFLYSRNRLNVATSRARCLAVVVASPELIKVRCRTARQVKLVNALCRYIELAMEVAAPAKPAPASSAHKPVDVRRSRHWPRRHGQRDCP